MGARAHTHTHTQSCLCPVRVARFQVFTVKKTRPENRAGSAKADGSPCTWLRSDTGLGSRLHLQEEKPPPKKVLTKILPEPSVCFRSILTFKLNQEVKFKRSKSREPKEIPAIMRQQKPGDTICSVIGKHCRSDSLMSQFWPVQPGRHSQKYPPIRFRQALALMQGLSAHSLASETRRRSTNALREQQEEATFVCLKSCELSL